MNLLSINDLTLKQITEILTLARYGRLESLEGCVVANLFYEPSTRTRLSFELAAIRQGAEVITFDVDTSSEQKGESMKDTALTLQALGADVLVVRSPARGFPAAMSEWVDCAVVNAGDGSGEHPTQALADLYTMKQHFGRIAGLRVGIVGDVHHSRVANSLYLALAKMGAETVLIGPRLFVSSRPGPYVRYDLDAELSKLDVCYVLRAQTERHNKLTSLTDLLKAYKLTTERTRLLPKDAIVMHPGPMNRGVEIDSDVADSQPAIQQQVTNGVVVRSALLYWLLNERSEESEVPQSPRYRYDYRDSLYDIRTSVCD